MNYKKIIFGFLFLLSINPLSLTATFSNLKELKEELSYPNYIQKEWDSFIEQVFHKSYLQFSGYYLDQIERGRTPYGNELHDKIRVSLINGMLNIRSDMDVILKIFSECHGNIPIHYVYRPTEGWTKDLITSGISKMGFVTPYAKLLAETWKSLIEEMGGIGQGGIIIHYAHSIGASDTFVAKDLLTLEEQQMVHVITLGSPTIIPIDSGFGSAVNYASRRDGVCFLDPIGYFIGYFFENSKIEFIGTHWGIPLVDHTLYTESYGTIIEELGTQFIQIHGNTTASSH